MVTLNGVTSTNSGVVIPVGKTHKAGSLGVVKSKGVEEIGPSPSWFLALITNEYVVLHCQPLVYTKL